MFPPNKTGPVAEAALPVAERPVLKVSVGSTQLSSALVEQLVPLPVVGAEAVAKTPCARLSEPYDVEI